MTNFVLYAQQHEQVVKGKVTDKESKTPLFGASIILLNSDTLIGTISDFDGMFRFKVPLGRQNFKISYIGYEDVFINDIVLSSGKEVELNIEMREKFSNLKEVVIVGNEDKTIANNSMATISARQLRTEDASKYAGGFYDPARMVSSFAGVGATEGDGSNQIVIRGNSPRGLLWRLEGIEIPNPNHFPDGQGDAGGAFCILTSNLLNNFDFYTGAFPAEYGNAYSGIMDVSLRKGNSDKREYSLIVGLVGTQLTLEGPLKKAYQGSYLISYRYSNFGLLNKAGLLGLAENHLPPLFQDLNFNFYLPTRKIGVFGIFGSAGNSWTGWESYQDSTKWKSWDDRKDDAENHKMGVFGIKHSYNFHNQKTYIKTVLAVTHQSDDLSTSFVLSDLKKQIAFKSNFSIHSIRINSLIHHKFNARHSLRAGITYSSLFSEMFMRKYNWDDGSFNTQIDKADETALLQGFAQWKYRISETFEVNTGLHSMFFMLNNDYSIEPRLGIKWNCSKKQSLSAGIGIHTRIENIPSYFALVKNESGQTGEFNNELSFTKSMHFIVGHDLNISKNLRLKTELYYQYIFNVPIVDTLNSVMSASNFSYGIPETKMTNKGLGQNYGIELTLEKFYSNNYYFLLTASIFESKYKANNSEWMNTAYNNNYITNFLIGKDFKVGKNRQNTIGVNIKSLIRGGFRYIPFDFEKSVQAGDEVYIWEQSFSKQYPMYQRFDLGLSYQKNLEKWNWSISMNIYNVLNQKGVLSYELRHDETTNEYRIAKVEGLGIVPNLNLKIDF